ncbi:MAG: NAD(P)/FAD-dependent oxidoreductase [Acidobacteriaceae bacterium]
MTYDIAVIGSGFAGSLFAMIARRQGRSVILLERGRHPRMVIGESSTPLSNLLLEELSNRYALPAVRPLAKWGSWQAQYPHVPCGLKRGFSFFHHRLRHHGPTQITSENHFLVAASPHDAISDTHWYRADFDHFLVEQAQKLGVEYMDELHLHRFDEIGDHVELAGNHLGRDITIRALFAVDATGPRGCLHRLLNLPENSFQSYPATQALYSHFSGVTPLATESAHWQTSPPYPIEAAAVHHVFDGGWVWLLHFNNGITSAGIAATEAIANRLYLAEGSPAWRRFLKLIPPLADQFAKAEAVLPFAHLPRMPFRSGKITGKRWALLPSAAGFVDPLLSTGFPLTLLGISRLATAFERHWEQPSLQGELCSYATSTEQELGATAQLIGALYANMDNFAVFRAISMLYFAAASFSETVRRLEKPRLAQSFLLCNDPRFGPTCRQLLERAYVGIAARDGAAFLEDIWRAIEPFDVAGLCTRSAIPWYPVNAEDPRRSAWKVGATEEEIERMLDRSGFHLASSVVPSAH